MGEGGVASPPALGAGWRIAIGELRKVWEDERLFGRGDFVLELGYVLL